MKYKNIPEEEIKNKITRDFFQQFDCTRILGKIDFAVKARAALHEDVYLLWAEAKQRPTDIFVMLAQLVLTIGKARTFDGILPPAFLGCYDSEKIAFVPYHEIQDIFYQNDFNWNVAPSNRNTKEFKQVYEKIKKVIENKIHFETCLFYFEKNDNELRRFIRENFVAGKTDTSKIKIDKNNFKNIFNKWTDEVLPSIAVNWDLIKKSGLIAGDFYLADLLSAGNKTLKDKLFVLLQSNYYEIDRHLNEFEIFTSSKIEFKDKQKAHNQFWAKYERPPLEDYWDYILNRRDLLVPPDIRERKGSFFTPKIWVELSQRYIADVLGENWQEEYYVWDCAAGTGNLLEGLTNKYNIWASTLDKQDAGVMKDRIKNGTNLLESHVFQFDFLNDDFSKLPQGLQDIINDRGKRKKLLVYINPPYQRGLGVTNTKWHKKEMGGAKDELFAQFIYRIYCEIPNCVLAEFSKLKILQAPNFSDFRKLFRAKLEKVFFVPANSFDNVTGQFPVGFFVWNTGKNEIFKQISADIYLKTDNRAFFDGQKAVFNYDNKKLINDWLNTFSNKKNKSEAIGFINAKSNDFQHNNHLVIGSADILSRGDIHKTITQNNLIERCIYFAVRKVIPANWLNDRDQFLYPNKKWERDN